MAGTAIVKWPGATMKAGGLPPSPTALPFPPPQINKSYFLKKDAIVSDSLVMLLGILSI